MEGYIDRELALTLVQRLKNWVQGAARQKPVRSWHHLSSIYSVSRILPLPLLLLRTHLRTPLAFVPPFSGMYYVCIMYTYVHSIHIQLIRPGLADQPARSKRSAIALQFLHPGGTEKASWTITANVKKWLRKSFGAPELYPVTIPRGHILVIFGMFYCVPALWPIDFFFAR